MAKANDNPVSETLPTGPDPWEVLNRLTAAMEQMASRQADNPSALNEQLMSTLGTALSRLADTQLEGAKLVANETRAAARRSNEVAPGVSVFNRRGTLVDEKDGPHKPQLKCTMLIPWLVEWECCTREEVELLNLLEAGEYQIRRIDKTAVKVSIGIDYKADGRTPTRLILTHETAYNKENFRLMPPLTDILRGMLSQHDPDIRRAAAAVLTDEEEEALILSGQLEVSA